MADGIRLGIFEQPVRRLRVCTGITTEQEQGEYIAHAYQMMKNWGFVGVAFLWNLNYNQTQPGSELAAFGITGRSAYSMIQGMPR